MKYDNPSLNVQDIGEQGLLKLVQSFCPMDFVGDDAAVLSTTPERSLVVTTDVLVDGVHFSDQTTSASDAGWRAAAANLSDLAAMGAAPLGLTVGLGLPGATSVAWVEGLYRGLTDCLSQYGGAIVGGDLCRSPIITIAITAFGEADPSRIIRRSTAQPGDAIMVTGVHGASKAGLELLLHPEHGRSLSERDRALLIQAHQRPRPRFDVVELLWAEEDKAEGRGQRAEGAGEDKAEGRGQRAEGAREDKAEGRRQKAEGAEEDKAEEDKAEGRRQKAEGAEEERQTPSPTSFSSSPTLHSPLPTPHSPLPTPDSRLPTPHSPLPTPDSPLPTPHSLLPTHIAGMDSSDGLADAVIQICRASRVGARLERCHIPVPPALESWVQAEQSLEWALYGGEDFELVLCLPLEWAQRLVEELGDGAAIVGTITDTSGVWLVDTLKHQPDMELTLERGFQHFGSRV